MEGTQPSIEGGDGAPTAMVAVPGLPGALTQAFPLLGGSGTVSMEASLRLRAKDYAAHDRWLVNLQDVITSNRLDDLWENQQVPTLEAVQRQFSQETSEKQQELYSIAMKQWQTENTQLYFLVKDSIIISGDWETLDRETIKNRFTNGRLRDGLAFIAWVNSFHDHTSEDGQIALNAEFKRVMVVKPDGAGGNLASMRKR